MPKSSKHLKLKFALLFTLCIVLLFTIIAVRQQSARNRENVKALIEDAQNRAGTQVSIEATQTAQKVNADAVDSFWLTQTAVATTHQTQTP